MISLVLSSTDELEVGDQLAVELEFSRANEGYVIDSGGTLTMGCSFYWIHADGSSFLISGDCDVRRSSGGYAVTVVDVSNDETQLSGTLTFSPVPNGPIAYTPGRWLRLGPDLPLARPQRVRARDGLLHTDDEPQVARAAV